MDNILFTLFSVQSIIPAIALLLIGIFLLKIPEKTSATFHLAFSLILYSMVPLSYFFSSSLYDPIAGYNRWIAAYIGIPSAFHAILFFVYYPSPVRPVLTKWIIRIGWIVIIIGWIIFIVSTLNSNMIYRFSGHNYELNAIRQQKILAIAIPLIGIIFMISGITRIIITRGNERTLATGIFFSYLILTIIPAAGNVLSRDGIISRGMYMNLFDIITLIGVFFTIIIYINFSREKTSILVKIIGVSVVVILLVIQSVSNIALNYLEKSYDEKKIRDALMEIEHPEKPILSTYIHIFNSEEKIKSKNKQEIIQTKNTNLKRFYRENPKTKNHFIAYLLQGQDNNQVYEVGFDYRQYRQEMHQVTKNLIYIILIVMIIILFGYRLFFHSGLIFPISTLLAGLKEVEEGNLNINLKMQVKDEIGIMTESFNRMVRSIKSGKLKTDRYASTLEKKVKNRTSELSETLDRVNKLKEKQDGDYFLTSLILKPLGPNSAKSKYVQTDFIIEQKKKFRFRKWESHIGGDICITDNLAFQSKPYVIFINADAMGKSLQGASGAIVLGAAFKSILERSKYSPEIQKQTPERWLKNTFIELQNIFESFDGSMLMSAVFGLVDEKTGFVYYINAEHPWSILYRDNQAEFFEQESLYRKLGSPLIAGGIHIKTMKMQKGDVLFFGSDGRDDILLPDENETEDLNENQQSRKINEDETLFLRIVQKAQGDLRKINYELKKIGDFMDDLSILRIEYFGLNKDHELDCYNDELLKNIQKKLQQDGSEKILKMLKEKSEKCPHSKQIAKHILKYYLSQKNYSSVIQFAEKYMDNNPWDLNALFALSYAYKKEKNVLNAINTGEQIRLRSPNMINNLINLAESYYIIKNYNRAKKIVEEALNFQPDIPRGQKLLNRIENKIAEESL